MARMKSAALILVLSAAGLFSACDLFGKAEASATYHQIDASIEVKTLEATQ